MPLATAKTSIDMAATTNIAGELPAHTGQTRTCVGGVFAATRCQLKSFQRGFESMWTRLVIMLAALAAAASAEEDHTCIAVYGFVCWRHPLCAVPPRSLIR